MSTFVKEACKFVQAMFEPILVDGLSGKVSAEVLDGYIDIWVPVSQRDQRRLEPNYWAFNTLIQTLAQVLASELPDGVTSDAIAIRLLPPGTRSRARLQQARQTQHSHQLPAEILGMRVEELLRRLDLEPRSSRTESFEFDTSVENSPGWKGDDEPNNLIGFCRRVKGSGNAGELWGQNVQTSWAETEEKIPAIVCHITYDEGNRYSFELRFTDADRKRTKGRMSKFFTN
jgi:hypothetical protein